MDAIWGRAGRASSLGALRAMALAGLVLAGATVLIGATARGTADAAERSVARQDVPAVPCDAPVDTSQGAWRLVDAEDVTFCLPASWKLNKKRASFRGMAIEWRRGILEDSRRRPFVVTEVRPGGMPTPMPSATATGRVRQSEQATIAGRAVQLRLEDEGARFASTATWTEPNFHFAGTARTAEEALSLWEIYRTARPKLTK